MPAKRVIAGRTLPVFAAAVVAFSAILYFRQPQARAVDRIDYTPHAPLQAIKQGSIALRLGEERDGFLFVPRGNAATSREPLLILLHGATQRARLFERVTATADSIGVVILAPDSRGMTWDAIRDEFGLDVQFLNRAIALAFDHAWIDPCRIVIGGFSDGASYALSLGIRNARELRGVVAFSPGFIIPAKTPQRLPVFARHGTRDEILPIDGASRPLVAGLRRAGFDVDYDEFDGPHTFRSADLRPAMEWVTRRSCLE